MQDLFGGGASLFKWWCNSGEGLTNDYDWWLGGGGVQNSLKSDDVYVKDPLLYYTGEKKSFFLSTVKVRKGK